MSTFSFQRFSILQDRTGMKVCTDATLFGAMMPVSPGDRVLDVGSGTGLLSLMAAQLGAGEVTGVELTQSAWEESCINSASSPWSENLRMHRQDIREYAACSDEQFDLIVSNPPFFQHHQGAQTDLRNTARHADCLPYAELLQSVAVLLRRQGLFYVLLPYYAVEEFSTMARAAGLYLVQQIAIRGYTRNKPKVCSLVFSDLAPDVRFYRMHTIYQQTERLYSVESTHYLKTFLLRFAEKNRRLAIALVSD